MLYMVKQFRPRTFFLHLETLKSGRGKVPTTCVVFHLPFHLPVRPEVGSHKVDLSELSPARQAKFLHLMHLRAQFVAALTDHQLECESATNYSAASRRRSSDVAIISDATRSKRNLQEVYDATLADLVEHYQPTKTVLVFQWPRTGVSPPALPTLAEKLAPYVRKHGRLVTVAPRGFSLARPSSKPAAR